MLLFPYTRTKFQSRVEEEAARGAVISCTARWLKVWSGGRLRPHASVLLEGQKEGGGELRVVEPDSKDDD
jgi:hypothetical protein